VYLRRAVTVRASCIIRYHRIGEPCVRDSAEQQSIAIRHAASREAGYGQQMNPSLLDATQNSLPDFGMIPSQPVVTERVDSHAAV
jgi:hypothetical protein